MGTEQNSPSNQTQNGSNENNQTSAGNTTETMFNENNSTMEEVNLNPSEEAQQQGGNVAAPGAGGTEQTGEAASSGSDLGTTGSNEAPVEDLADEQLPLQTKECQEELTVEALMKKLKAEGYLDENGEVTELLNKKLKTLMELSDRGCRNPMVKLLYSARELKAAGHVFCFDKENREINNNHVTELYDRIKNDKSKRFMETLKVCEVKQALEQGRKVFDVDGNEITLDTPNLEKYILILDGQHRWIVILENPEYDIWVDFVVTKKIGAYIDNLNNSSKSWTGEDVKHSIRVQHENEVPVLDEINKFKNRFGVSEKYAEIILTRNKEQFRLSEMKEFQSHTKEFNADKFKVNTTYIDTGKNLMFAIIHQFGTEKLVRKIEFLEALFNIHEELIDAKKASFEKNILIFLTAMNGFVKGEILSKVKAKDIQKLNSYVRKQYDTLLNKHNGEGELEQMYNSAMEIIRQKETEFEKKENNPSKSFKKLKSGSPAEILANRKAEREDAEAKKTSESKPKKGKGTSSKASNDSKVSDKK